jgi:hypothetical protein
VPHGSPQFTPKQLLDAARRVEAEGKPDVAHQFYWHLNDQYEFTPEAVEGRSSLTRLAIGSQYAPDPRLNGGAPRRPAVGARRAIDRALRARPSTRSSSYRIGRTLAALLTGAGWLTIACALLALAAGLVPDMLQIPALPEVRVTFDVVLRIAAALLAGGASVLCGQVARALFDLAGALREFVAIERTRAGSGQP